MYELKPIHQFFLPLFLITEKIKIPNSFFKIIVLTRRIYCSHLFPCKLGRPTLFAHLMELHFVNIFWPVIELGHLVAFQPLSIKLYGQRVLNIDCIETVDSLQLGFSVIKVWDIRKCYSIYHSKLPQACFSLPHPGGSLKNGFTSLSVDAGAVRLYANCMDSNIYCYNISTYEKKPGDWLLTQ